MKAEINSTGTLKITAETGVERFALRKWWEAYMDKDGNTDVVLQAEYVEPGETLPLGVTRMAEDCAVGALLGR